VSSDSEGKPNSTIFSWRKACLPNLHRLLDPENVSVTLLTLESVALALGKKLKVQCPAVILSLECGDPAPLCYAISNKLVE
jgi:hypothetical protein